MNRRICLPASNVFDSFIVKNKKGHLLLKLCTLIFVSVIVPSCTGESMKAVYQKEALQPT